MAAMVKNEIVTDEMDFRRKKIADFEETCKAAPEQVEIPITHYFSKDVYAREMRVKKGVILVGKIHKYMNLNILSAGEVSVLSEEFGAQRFKAPYTFVAKPGAKRVIMAHEDCVWTVIHGTSETSVDRIEEQFIAKDYGEVASITAEQFKALKEAKCLG